MSKAFGTGCVLALCMAAGTAMAVTPRIISFERIGDDQLPQTRTSNTVVFSATTGPYSAFGADTGYLGADDYTSTYAEGFAYAYLQSFKFVGGVTTAGQVIHFDFFDATQAFVDGFDLALPQGGNFIWNIGLESATDAKDSTFQITPGGYMQATCPAGSTGQWFLSTSVPTIGTDDPLFTDAAGYSYRFELTTSGGTNTPPNPSIGPAVSGLATPGVFDQCGGVSVLTITIDDPGSNPVGTNFAVTVDTASVGGGVVNMLDDGLGADAVAGDLTFTASVSIPPGVDSTIPLPIVVSFDRPDPQTVNAAFNLDRDQVAGTIAQASNRNANLDFSPAGRSIIQGNSRGGGDVEMFRIFISDPNTFSASLVGGATWDTRLYLFGPTGQGLLFNDDSATTNFQSFMGGVALNPLDLGTGGLAYLALTAYGNDAQNAAAQAIWADQPYETTRTPDGVGAADPVLASFSGAGTAGGTYTITMTGAVTPCPADLTDSSGSGIPDGGVDINDLLYFLVGFEQGSQAAADVSSPTEGAPDCGIDVNDLLFFLAHLELGC